MGGCDDVSVDVREEQRRGRPAHDRERLHHDDARAVGDAPSIANVRPRSRSRQMGAHTRALAAHEVPVGRGDAPSPRVQGARRRARDRGHSPARPTRTRRRGRCGRGPAPPRPAATAGSRGRPARARRARPGAHARPRPLASRSQRRPLVHEPMKTQWMARPSMRWPGAGPCTRAPAPTGAGRPRRAPSAGSGTAPSTAMQWAGLDAPGDLRSRPRRRRWSLRASNVVAPGSLASVRQCSTASRSRHRRARTTTLDVLEGDVVGCDEPDLGPQLHREVADRHPLLDAERLDQPTRRTRSHGRRRRRPQGGGWCAGSRSFGSTAGAEGAFEGDPHRRRAPLYEVWVASTWATSVVPTPKPSAPRPPLVQVWLSPQTTVTPGSVRPSSGPMTCTMPCSGSSRCRTAQAVLAEVAAASAARTAALKGLLSSVRPREDRHAVLGDPNVSVRRHDLQRTRRRAS